MVIFKSSYVSLPEGINGDSMGCVWEFTNHELWLVSGCVRKCGMNPKFSPCLVILVFDGRFGRVGHPELRNGPKWIEIDVRFARKKTNSTITSHHFFPSN